MSTESQPRVTNIASDGLSADAKSNMVFKEIAVHSKAQ